MNIHFLNINELKALRFDPMVITKERRIRMERFKPENAKSLSACAELSLIAALSLFVPKDEIIIYSGTEQAGKALETEEELPLRIMTEEGGKPCFAPESRYFGKVFFNLSHAGEWAVAAVSDSPVGIDLERIRKRTPSFEKKILHEKEYDIFRALPEEEGMKFFFECWVRKESFLKRSGIGLMGRPGDFLVNESEFETIPGTEAAEKLSPGHARLIKGSDLEKAGLNQDFLENYRCAVSV